MKRGALIILLFFGAFGASIFGHVHFAAAARHEIQEPYIITPRLQVDIPGIKPFTQPVVRTAPIPGTETERKILDIDFISVYLIGLYQYLVGIAAIAAGVMIVWAGFRWLTSGGAPDRISDAKKKIAGAIVGMALVFGSYLIVYLINPDLVFFKPLRITQIQRIELAEAEESDESYDPQAQCPDAAAMRAVARTEANLGFGQGRDLLLPEAGTALINAARIAAQRGYGLWVCSAGRTLQKQQTLWDEAVARYGDEEIADDFVARPRCGAPHLTGRTVDVVLFSQNLQQPITGNGCTKDTVSSRNATQTTAEQRTLETIMFDAGWRRYCVEWWHFEYNTPSAQRAQSAGERCIPRSFRG